MRVNVRSRTSRAKIGYVYIINRFKRKMYTCPQKMAYTMQPCYIEINYNKFPINLVADGLFSTTKYTTLSGRHVWRRKIKPQNFLQYNAGTYTFFFVWILGKILNVFVIFNRFYAVKFRDIHFQKRFILNWLPSSKHNIQTFLSRAFFSLFARYRFDFCIIDSAAIWETCGTESRCLRTRGIACARFRCTSLHCCCGISNMPERAIRRLTPFPQSTW